MSFVPASVINSLARLVEIVVQSCPNHEWTFRGQTADWPLLPKAFRKEFCLPPSRGKDTLDDLTRFQGWCRQAIAFDPNFPGNYLERLAVAQHHGLATRLLDWTANAAVALYFATEESAVEPKNSDGFVYVYRKPQDECSAENISSHDDLRKCPNVLFYRPRLVTRRILAQDGEFTIHPSNQLLAVREFDSAAARYAKEGAVLRMSVPAAKKHGLQRQLRAVGIQARTLFPDLEGLAKSSNWQTRDIVKRSDDTAQSPHR